MRISSVLPDLVSSRQNPFAHGSTFWPIGDVPVMSALHCLLETASEARQRGDHGAADLLERDAARMLRAALQASTPEGGS